MLKRIFSWHRDSLVNDFHVLYLVLLCLLVSLGVHVLTRRSMILVPHRRLHPSCFGQNGLWCVLFCLGGVAGEPRLSMCLELQKTHMQSTLSYKAFTHNPLRVVIRLLINLVISFEIVDSALIASARSASCVSRVALSSCFVGSTCVDV